MSNLSTLHIKKKKNPMRLVLSLSDEKTHSEKLVNLPKITQRARNRVRNRAREVLSLQSNGV